MCLTALITVSIYKWLPRYAPETPILTTIDPEITLEVEAKENTIDSDLDGLRDWQEVLWGTDPANPDSDGDKTSDGDEVYGNRNPAVAGPNDALDQPEAKTQTAQIYAGVKTNSLTDNISKEMFYSLLQTKKARGVAFSSEDLQNIATSIANETLQEKITYTKYTAAAIATFPDNDLERGETYGQEFGDAYLNMLVTVDNGPEDSVFIAKQFEDLSKELSILYVPQSLEKSHTELVNGMYNIAVVLVIANDYEKDPIRAMLALKAYQRLSEEQKTLLTAIANYFRRSDILFSDREVQSLWENL